MDEGSGIRPGDPADGEATGAGSDDADEDAIMSMVRRQLDRANPPDTKALYGRAIRLDPSIRELSLRQFHAKYPLKIKRERARREEDG
jgi:hypothetical protein